MESFGMTPCEQDRILVERSLANEAGAFDELFAEFNWKLISSIRAFLGRAGQDRNLVDEITARVWLALVKDGKRLLAAFNAERGCRLSTFLSTIAKTQARMLLRSDRRRKIRELVASRRERTFDVRSAEGLIEDAEFLASLTPAEETFLKVGERGLSPANTWQLRHRLRKKVEQFIFA